MKGSFSWKYAKITQLKKNIILFQKKRDVKEDLRIFTMYQIETRRDNYQPIIRKGWGDESLLAFKDWIQSSFEDIYFNAFARLN